LSPVGLGTAGALDWNTPVLPVLEVAHECSGEPEGFAHLGEVDTDALNQRLGRERHDAQTVAVLQSLTRNGYIEVTDGGPDQMDGPRLFALTVHLTHFDIERLGWEEGDIIAGLVLSADEKLSTGRMRVSCDAEARRRRPAARRAAYRAC
jgi:hypothetical protein